MRITDNIHRNYSVEEQGNTSWLIKTNKLYRE